MKEKPSYKVILWDFNRKKTEFYDVIPYFMEEYKELRKKDRPETREQWFEWVKRIGMYQFWSRCQYEILVDGFPSSIVRINEADTTKLLHDISLSESAQKTIQAWLNDKIDEKPCIKLDVWDQIEANLPIVVELLMSYYGK